METTPTTRREFLRRLTLAGAATLLPTAALAGPNGIPAGKVADFKPGEYKSVTLPGGMAYVQRLPGKKVAFLALNAACTHKGCPVNWDTAQRQFLCPCHGGRYDAMGKNIAGPPPAPLASLPTRVVKGIVYIVA